LVTVFFTLGAATSGVAATAAITTGVVVVVVVVSSAEVGLEAFVCLAILYYI
jgi:hypothetical protein